MAEELAPITVEGTPAPAPAAPVYAYQPSPGFAEITDPSGEISTVRAEDVQAALAEGAHTTTQAEEFARRNGAAGTIAAGLAGAARGASFGISDPLTVAAGELLDGPKGGEEMREYLRLLKEGHSAASFAGEIGGSLAPLALGAPNEGSAAVAGESFLARAGSRALAAAPRAFLEGAAIAEGQQLSEDTLGNHEIVASKYLNAGIEGGLVGLILGSALHAGGGAIADKIAGRAARAAERAALSGGEEAAVATGASSKLATLAEEQAAKGAMPSASLAGSELQKLGTTAEAQQRRIHEIGRTLIDEGITTAGATKSVQAKRLAQRIEQVGEDLGSQRKALETSAARPSADAVRGRIIAEVVEPLKARAFTSDIQNAIYPYAEELDKRMAGKSTFESFEQLQKLIDDLDEKVKWKNGVPPPTPAIGELRTIRRIMKEEYEFAAERAAADLGDDVATKYRTTKAIFGDLREAQKWITKGVARDTQNQALSLTDILAGGGSLVGNVVSGNILGAAGDLAGVVANKVRRKLGNQIAAVVLDKMSRLEMLGGAQQKFDAKLGSSVESYFSNQRPTSAAARARQKISPEQRKALREAIANPSALAERVSSQLSAGGMAEAAPKVTQAATAITMRAAAYLQQRMPSEPRPTGLTPGKDKPRAIGLRAQVDLDNAVRALNADKTMDDLAAGRLDRQAWEAIRIINPPLHDQMVGKIKRYVTDNQPTLDRQKLVALSIITGEPLTPYMEPKTIRGLQKAYATPGPAGPTPSPSTQVGVTEPKPFGGGSRSSGGGGRSRSAASYASGSDKLEMGEI